MPHCVRVLAFLALSFGFATFGVPASADQPSQQCLSNLFEDLFVMRAQRAGLQVLRFKDAQGTIRIPANDPAAQAGKDRHFDIVVIDSAQPDRPLSIELTNRLILSPYAAKRLSIALNGVLREYEQRYGALNV